MTTEQGLNDHLYYRRIQEDEFRGEGFYEATLWYPLPCQGRSPINNQTATMRYGERLIVIARGRFSFGVVAIKLDGAFRDSFADYDIHPNEYRAPCWMFTNIVPRT